MPGHRQDLQHYLRPDGRRAATVSADGTANGDWNIVWAPIASTAEIKFYCDEEVGSALLPPNVASDFVKDLGAIFAPSGGGTVTLHKDGTYGPLDATVVVTVAAESQ